MFNSLTQWGVAAKIIYDAYKDTGDSASKESVEIKAGASRWMASATY